jgi:hypothetical protein
VETHACGRQRGALGYASQHRAPCLHARVHVIAALRALRAHFRHSGLDSYASGVGELPQFHVH